jgi:DNA (cytosine-5)-methyltransferase 1
MHAFYEFFAGGGMARAGLGEGWACAFANDIDPKKAVSYQVNWGVGDFHLNDVAALTTKDLPGCADLAWASFPCQDLSLAGAGAGLKGQRSGTFWPFWGLMRELKAEGRAPRLIVLENVCGALNSHGGRDFAAIGNALAAAGYKFGAMVIDAVHFLPQSRPRLFFIAVQAGTPIPATLTISEPDPAWHSEALIQAKLQLSARAATKWVWWTLPTPLPRTTVFADVIEENPQGVMWHTPEQTTKLLGMMSPINLKKVDNAKKTGRTIVGGVYKRTRLDENGQKAQRAEVRFDDVAGCLRTPTGGSSRQLILVVKGKKIRSRLLSTREAVRLMGLPDSYALPKNYNEAYHLAGDGVAVPVVRYLAENVLEQILATLEIMAAA